MEAPVETQPAKNGFIEFAKTIVKIIAVVVFLRLFIIQPFYVKGNSMEPSFHNGEYLIVEKVSYLFRGPARGDVVVFHYPRQEHACARVTNYFERATEELIDFFTPEKCTNFIKRIVGLPGETIELTDGNVYVINRSHPEGFMLTESYIDRGLSTLPETDQTRFDVPAGQYLVLGDNRNPGGSSDSREWGFLPANLILGRVGFQVYPLDFFGFTASPKYSN